MNRTLKSFLLFIALLATLATLAGCGNSEPDDDSATQAAAQLGLGGDDLAASSNALDVQAEGAQLGRWTSDFPAAQKLAQEQDLPILLFFNGSDWSIASNTFIQNVLQNQEWLDYLPNLVPVYLDFPRHNPNFPAALKAQNEAMRHQFGVRDFPCILLCTNEGQLAGNLHANSQTNAHDLVRNLKLFRRRIPSEIDKLVAKIEDPAVQENFAAFKALTAEHHQLIRETQEKLKEMEERLSTLGMKVEADIRDWEVARLTPEDQAAYLAAEQARDAAQAELEAFMKGTPARTPENQQKLQALQQIIQRQQLVIDEIITK